MSVSAASSVSPTAYAWLRREFQSANAGSSSSSSSSNSAQTSDTASSSQTTQSGSYSPSATLSNGFLTFLTDVQSGKLSAAQGALSTVESDLGLTSQDSGTSTGTSQVHHHHHGGSGNTTASSSTTTGSADSSTGTSNSTASTSLISG